MKLLSDLQNHTELTNGVVATIGNFDGVHLGHQNLLSVLRHHANQLSLPLVVILFEPQPREYFEQAHAPARLTSLREKLQALQTCEVDYVYCMKFNAQIAQTNAIDFANIHLFSQLKVKHLLVGVDFRFGKGRAGGVDLLTELGKQANCEVQVAEDFCLNNEKISSTKIRLALAQGQFDLAAHYLGRQYSVCGRVIYGEGRGKQWGIPTANLNLHRLTLPLKGVYVVEVEVGNQRVQGVANIGTRPTVGGLKNNLEVHLFNFNKTIYGEMLRVFFLHKLRDEVKFLTVNDLKAQIHQDIRAAQAFLNQKK